MRSTGYVPLDQASGKEIGFIDCSFFGSLNVQSWLLFWKSLSGVGIAGEHPLIAVIAFKFAPIWIRPQNLPTKFAMQGFGIAAGQSLLWWSQKWCRACHPYSEAASDLALCDRSSWLNNCFDHSPHAFLHSWESEIYPFQHSWWDLYQSIVCFVLFHMTSYLSLYRSAM